MFVHKEFIFFSRCFRTFLFPINTCRDPPVPHCSPPTVCKPVCLFFCELLCLALSSDCLCQYDACPPRLDSVCSNICVVMPSVFRHWFFSNCCLNAQSSFLIFWKTFWLSLTLSLDWLCNFIFQPAVVYYDFVWPVPVSWLHFPAWKLVSGLNCLGLQYCHCSHTQLTCLNNRQFDEDLVRLKWQTSHPGKKWPLSLTSNIQNTVVKDCDTWLSCLFLLMIMIDSHSCPIHIFL